MVPNLEVPNLVLNQLVMLSCCRRAAGTLATRVAHDSSGDNEGGSEGGGGGDNGGGDDGVEERGAGGSEEVNVVLESRCEYIVRCTYMYMYISTYVCVYVYVCMYVNISLHALSCALTSQYILFLHPPLPLLCRSSNEGTGSG